VAVAVKDVLAQKNKVNSICKAQAELKYTVVELLSPVLPFSSFPIPV